MLYSLIYCGYANCFVVKLSSLVVLNMFLVFFPEQLVDLNMKLYKP